MRQENLRFGPRPAHPQTGKLAAALSSATELHAAAMVVESVDVATRTVSGLLVPWGEVGYTTAGPVIVPGPGRIQLPAQRDWPRVKLVDEHQDPPRSVGYMTDVAERDNGLRAAFRIASTPDGDRVLAEMTPDENGGRARDGFSVELVHIELAASTVGPDVGELVRGQLSLVAAVTTPAWASARVDGLAAAQTTTTDEGNTGMTEEQRARLAELLANTARTDEENTELRELVTLAGTEAGVTCEAPEAEAEAEASEAPAAGTQLAASATVPGSLPGRGAAQRRSPQRPLRELYASMARVLSGHSRPELEAALSDITSTANIWTAGSEYDGQLWSGLEYVRRWVPLMTPGTLTSYKGTGWKWGVKPEVADYAGDKAAVPSNAPTTVEAPWNAARLAGAHDLDRKFFDFGDTEFIEAYYAAMRESYARQSDAKARAFLIANASAAGAGGASLFTAAATAAQAVEDATGGAQADWFLINSADRLGLLDVTSADIPAYLEAFGVTPDKFLATPGVPAGTVIGGSRQATKFRELAGSPIRVEAINIANGGVDGGVFGYYATNELVDGGVASATFA